MNRPIGVTVIVFVLHLAALGFAAGLLHWRYLLAAFVSGILIWGTYSTLNPSRRWVGLLIGIASALVVQQVAFRFWRAELGNLGSSLIQFTTVHALLGFGLARSQWQTPPCFFGDHRPGASARHASLTDRDKKAR